MKISYLAFAATALVLAGCGGGEKPPAPNPNPAPGPVSQWTPKIHAYQNIWRIDNQNWSDSDAAWYYNLTQGSQIVQYDIFKALELPKEQKPFSYDGLARFGYLAQQSGSDNPDALAVGFAKDGDKNKAWVGMTCAACHTNRIEVNGKVVQIDGSAGQGDLAGFLDELRDSIKATLADPLKFKRMARSILGDHPSKKQLVAFKNRLKQNLGHVQTIVTDSITPVPWGPARTDAFGMIFNRVAEVDLNYPQNRQTPDAPVSYPHIWDTGRFDWVQWNAVVPNKTDFEKLGRNTGEVLGVFGTAKLKKPTIFHYYYDSSVRFQNLKEMEQLVEKLDSPKWTDVVGPLDKDKLTRGAELYQAQGCSSCHELINTKDHDKPIVVNQTPVTVVGTDPVMAVNAGRTVHTRQLEGTKMPPIIGTKLTPVDSGVNLLTNAVTGTILKNIINPPNTLQDYLNPLDGGLTTEQMVQANKSRQINWKNYSQHKTSDQSVAESQLKDFDDKQRSEEAAAASSGAVYKGRPLDGIWATGPFLHNGSVPSLYQLLLPPDQRMAKFHVGATLLDTKNVGFDTESGPGIYDTHLKANSNAGHLWGTTLSDADRWALIEYLKSL